MRLLQFGALLAALFCAAGAASGQAGGTLNPEVRRTPIVVAVEKVHGMVVNISTERVVVVRRGFQSRLKPGSDPFDRMFEEFFGRQGYAPEVERRKVHTPLGSGSIITPDGLVITNEHVVRRATNITLSLDTGETFNGVLLAADPTEDLALLRIKADRAVPAIPMGVSSDLMLGESVVALGNPFGFENSVTSGIISAINREITVGAGPEQVKYTGLIQTSALINPGNSGGPLINVLGELVGINSAVVDHAQGIGFAIPIDRARDVLAPLLATPQVSEAWPGIRAVTTEGRDGVRVAEIDPKGPAGGLLETDDVIREIDGTAVNDLFDLLLGVVQHKPDDKISLKVVRDGKPVAVTLTLGRMPVPSPKKLLYDKLGIAGQNHTSTLAKQLGSAVDYGVLVSEVWRNGPAEEVGLKKGDVIIQIGARPVRNLHDAAAALQVTHAGERVFVRIVRQEIGAYAWIPVAR